MIVHITHYDCNELERERNTQSLVSTPVNAIFGNLMTTNPTRYYSFALTLIVKRLWYLEALYAIHDMQLYFYLLNHNFISYVMMCPTFSPQKFL